MGGKGSGKRIRGEERGSKPTADQIPTLDVRSLKRKGVITLGQERIGEGSERIPWIRLAWTPCNYGGSRPWFLCPAEGCGHRRVAILYGPTLPLLCRLCRGLRYASSQRRRRATRR